MAPIATFVFFDLETTGLPAEELNKTKITELSLVAVKRSHLLQTAVGSSPRVQQKLTLSLNPGRVIHPVSTKITGLCNDLLEHEPRFNNEVFQTINNFLNLLTKPVCFIAHNGMTYDYPILKRHLVDLNVSFSDDLVCADSLYFFYDEDASPSKTSLNIKDTSSEENVGDPEGLMLHNPNDMKTKNETTPRKFKSGISKMDGPTTSQLNITPMKLSKARRRIFFGDGPKPKKSYKLKYIYERLLQRYPVNSHRAESDCIMTLECSVAKAENFVNWVDNNHILFADVKPMTIGSPLGLLVLTGILWGCTNPFIRQGTKGLRHVHADSRLGQAYAEIIFLLGNWRYVLSWLLNQAGSLVYLAAVQQTPLSVAVPAANSLAFVFTAITGAAVGAEEPLDLRSYLGIVLIGAGTALCCWDKAE